MQVVIVFHDQQVFASQSNLMQEIMSLLLMKESQDNCSNSSSVGLYT